RSGCARALLPDLDREAGPLAPVFNGAAAGAGHVRDVCPAPRGLPYLALLQRADHIPLRAAGVALEQDPAIAALPDGKTRRSIVMRRTPRHPGGAGAVAAENLRDRRGAHDGSPALAVCNDRAPSTF